MKRIAVIALLIATLGSALGDKPKFRALKEDYAKKASVVDQLKGIPIHSLKIERKSPGEALSILQKAGSNNESCGVINFVIRFPREDGPPEIDPFSGDVVRKWEPRKVTLEEKSTTFASAVDQICQAAGMIWAIEFNETTGAPILVISAKQ